MLVARLELIVGWGPETDGGNVLKFSAVVPNMLVASPSAANIYHCLFHNAVVAPLLTSIKLLFSLSAWAIDLMEADGAYANDRLWAHWLRKRETMPVLDCYMRCRLHGSQLIEAAALSVLPNKPLSRLYSLSLLLRTASKSN